MHVLYLKVCWSIKTEILKLTSAENTECIMKSCKETELRINICVWQKLEMTKIKEKGGFWHPYTYKLVFQSYGLKKQDYWVFMH